LARAFNGPLMGETVVGAVGAAAPAAAGASCLAGVLGAMAWWRSVCFALWRERCRMDRESLPACEGTRAGSEKWLLCESAFKMRDSPG